MFEFVKANQAEHSVARICALLKVSTSGFYAWLARAPSSRELADRELIERISAIHDRSRGTYRVPRIHRGARR